MCRNPATRGGKTNISQGDKVLGRNLAKLITPKLRYA
jgi:hypothetical protein